MSPHACQDMVAASLFTRYDAVTRRWPLSDAPTTSDGSARGPPPANGHPERRALRLDFGLGLYEIRGSMHVIAFAPSTRVETHEGGGITADGFPMTSCHVDTFPKQITIPLVLAAYTQGGSDYDPRLYIVAKSPEGQRLSTVECTWHWPDKPGSPVKFWVLTRYLPDGGGICGPPQRRLV